MQHKKNIPDMQAEITQLRQTLALPGLPAEEIAIYQATIQRIQAEINGRQAQSVTPTPTPPPTEQIKHTAPPIPSPKPSPLEGGKGGENTPTGNHSTTQPIKIIAPAQLTPDQRAALSAATIDANLFASPPTVTINWPPWDFGPRTYTEGEARGALTTALRDLSESKLARQGRYGDLTRYAAWWRAIHYYRALTQFWGIAPNRAQLQLTRRDAVFTTIFNLVTEAAAQTQTTP